MNDEIKEKQLNEVLYGLDYIGNKIKNDDGKLELGINNCKLLLDHITNLQQENEELKKNQRFNKKFGNDYIFCVEGDKETYKDLLLEKQEELERKDNIINELKKHLEYEIEKWQDVSGVCIKAQVQEDKIILDKIKELEKM